MLNKIEMFLLVAQPWNYNFSTNAQYSSFALHIRIVTRENKICKAKKKKEEHNNNN